MARMIIPVNFNDTDDYEYVKSLPNSSHYIRELVRKDRQNQQSDREYIDKKIEELEKKLRNLPISDEKVGIIDEEMKKSVKNLFDMY